MVWLAPLGSTLKYSPQSPLPSAALPPSTLPTELTLAVGPLLSAPLEGQMALERNFPLARPSGLAARISEYEIQ